jgi:hypothetical protein
MRMQALHALMGGWAKWTASAPAEKRKDAFLSQDIPRSALSECMPCSNP